MKKFLFRSALMLAFSLALLAALELSFRAIPSNYRYKYQYLDTHAEELEVLILGSSLELDGVNASLLSRPAFNAAVSAQPPEMDSVLLARFLPRLSRLRVLVVPLSYFSLQHAPMPYSIYRFEYHDKWNYDCRNLEWRDRLALLCYKPRPMAELTAHHLVDPAFSFQTCDSLGWERNDDDFSRWSEADRQFNASDFGGEMRYKCGDGTPRNLPLYRDLIEECGQRGIEVILL